MNLAVESGISLTLGKQHRPLADLFRCRENTGFQHRFDHRLERKSVLRKTEVGAISIAFFRRDIDNARIVPPCPCYRESVPRCTSSRTFPWRTGRPPRVYSLQRQDISDCSAGNIGFCNSYTLALPPFLAWSTCTRIRRSERSMRRVGMALPSSCSANCVGAGDRQSRWSAGLSNAIYLLRDDFSPDPGSIRISTGPP
jgi:hypothetical protein